MDRCGLTNLTATGNELRTIFAIVAASTSSRIRRAVSMNSRPAMVARLPPFGRTIKTASSRNSRSRRRRPSADWRILRFRGLPQAALL
jgi:hypothetical protein